MTESAHRARRRGTVATFDEDAGLGTIVADDGAEHAFHCIEIADGSRTITTGTAVTFDLLAKLGRWEAANIGP